MLGLTCNELEGEIVKRLEQMEGRDRLVAGKGKGVDGAS